VPSPMLRPCKRAGGGAQADPCPPSASTLGGLPRCQLRRRCCSSLLGISLLPVPPADHGVWGGPGCPRRPRGASGCSERRSLSPRAPGAGCRPCPASCKRSGCTGPWLSPMPSPWLSPGWWLDPGVAVSPLSSHPCHPWGACVWLLWLGGGS